MPNLDAMPPELAQEIFALAQFEDNTPFSVNKKIAQALNSGEFYMRRCIDAFPTLPFKEPLVKNENVDDWKKRKLAFWKSIFNQEMKKKKIKRHQQRFFDELYTPYCNLHTELVKNPNSSRRSELDNLYGVFKDLFIKTSYLPIDYLNCFQNPFGSGNTLLHMASEINDLKMVKSLLRQGANLHVCNNMGNSPRGMAKNKGHLEILKALNLGWAYNNRPQDIIGCFVDYSECNFLPKWTAGMFRTFRKITHFPYGLRFDDIVSEAIRALSVDENENITTEQLTEFLGYLKYYANQKGVDLTQYKDGEVHRLLSWLYYMKIDFEDIAPLAPSVSFQAPVMSS